jgi:hypothetical protein
MTNIDYVTSHVSQSEQFLSDVFNLGGVMEIFKNHSISPFFFQLICMKVDVVFTEVFDKGTVGVRGLTGQLDDVVGHTIGEILFFCYFSYAFDHFTVVF